MSTKDMTFYDVPKLAYSKESNRLFTKFEPLKIVGIYNCSNGSKLALIEGESHLFSFDSLDIKGDWVDKPKKKNVSSDDICEDDMGK